MTHDREAVLAELREIEPELSQEFGIRRLRLFGSVATGSASAGSDVDLLVEFEETPTLFEMGRLKARVEERLGVPVDLVTPGGLRSRTLENARNNAVTV